MSDTPWTKGPWRVYYSDRRLWRAMIVGPDPSSPGDERDIAEVVSKDCAKLLAAAPQLAELLERMLTDVAGSPDHMTACERTMGATHPCTCGADQARALLAEIKGAKGV